jgi:hypothetical protein
VWLVGFGDMVTASAHMISWGYGSVVGTWFVILSLGRWSVRGCIPTLERGNDVIRSALSFSTFKSPSNPRSNTTSSLPRSSVVASSGRSSGPTNPPKKNIYPLAHQINAHRGTDSRRIVNRPLSDKTMGTM